MTDEPSPPADVPAPPSKPRMAWHDLDGPLGIGLLAAVLVLAIVLWATSGSDDVDRKGAPEKLVAAACFQSEAEQVVELKTRGGVIGDARVWAVRCEDGTGARVTSWGAVVPLRAGGDVDRGGRGGGFPFGFGPGDDR